MCYFVSHRDTYENKPFNPRGYMEAQPIAAIGEVSQNEEKPTILEILLQGFSEVIETDTDDAPLYI